MRRTFHVLTACAVVASLAEVGFAQQAQKPFEPQVGQPGKDVVWVPTPDALVEKMLDMAQVTPQDVVMDLGSGDGRNVIAAARRGARAIGVEFNPQMVELSRQNAAKAGVADRATFVEGDMYEADVSKATVLALFLLSTNLEKLTPKFLDMKPGSRIVDNTFAIPGWSPDAWETIIEDCTTWCTSLLWIVPAKVHGAWQSTDGDVTFEQEFQVVKGTHSSGGRVTPFQNGRLRGDQLVFSTGDVFYEGRVLGDTIEGTRKTSSSETRWTATRIR